jgi:hypothetical protein
MQNSGPLVRALEHAKVLFELATCLGNEACWIEGASDAEARGFRKTVFLHRQASRPWYWLVQVATMVMSSWEP